MVSTIRGDDGFDSAQYVNLLDTYAGRNKLINGNFDVWQRGTTQTSTNNYGSDDRWRNQASGSTRTNERIAFTLGQADVPGSPRYHSRTSVTTVNSTANSVIKAQRIESVLTFSGSKVTLSFWAKADASKNMSIEFSQNFGSGGSPSTTVNSIGVLKVPLTTTWQKIVHTFNVPSITGKQLGTDDNDFFSVNFWLDSGSNYDDRNDGLGSQSGIFDIAQVQLEAGDTPTEFETKPYGQVLAECQRYYWQGDCADSLGYKYGTGGLTLMLGTSTTFPVTMRKAVTPTIITNPSYQNCAFYSIQPERTGFSLLVSVTATGKYRADSGDYAVDAEL